jgi:23S rRNA (uracil1939-C5)-methyltransferase
MIARVDGQVVLVAGSIPGERVTARIDRVGRGVAFAETVSVQEPSPDRRTPFTDPLCGGCGYAHIGYERQLEIKAQVVADAFARIGRLELPSVVRVRASPDEGYRMRARLHLRGRRAGFFREGTHEVCDARATRQLLPATSEALDRLLVALSLDGTRTAEVDVSENVDASGRAVHVTGELALGSGSLESLRSLEGITGLSIGPEAIAGTPYVIDVLTVGGTAVTLRRHVLAFFQGNRFLLGDLVAHVTARIPGRTSVVDLYAGVGVFAVAAAAVRGSRVVAVEGDRVAASDLEANAAPSEGGIETACQSVEEFTARARQRPSTLVVDPPRTGMSKEALRGAIGLRAAQVIYVSCDVATLARDARRLADAGYRLKAIDAFDLFPNTPHVETVADFEA